jgi:hypothetical protein
MPSVRARAFCASFVFVFAAGCGGGGRALPHDVAGGAAAAASTERITIVIPRAGATPGGKGRRPAYISPAAQSVSVSVTAHGSTTPVAGFPQVAGLTPTSTGCSSTLAGTQCTLNIALLPGSYDVSLTIYDRPDATGNLLSVAQSVPFTVLAGQSNVLAVTLGGVVASVVILSLAAAGYALPPNGSVSVSVFGVDRDGNIILGAGAPAVALTSSDPSKVSVGSPTAAAPNAFVLTSHAASFLISLKGTATPEPSSGRAAVTCLASLSPTQMVGLGARMYVLTYNSASLTARTTIYDATGVAQTNGLPPIVDNGVLLYDSANGYLYLLDYNPPIGVNAYDQSGTLHTLSPGFAGRPYVLSSVYDPDNGLLYFADGQGAISAFDQNGNPQPLAGAFPNAVRPQTMAYDAQNQRLYFSNSDGTLTAYGGDGSQQTVGGDLATVSGAGPMAFDSANGLLYVWSGATIQAYGANENAQALPGSFPGLQAPSAIAFDPDNRLLYVAEGNAIDIFDENGNAVGTFTRSPLGGSVTALVFAP